MYLATEPAAVGVRQVVVHRLRHADTDDGIPELLADLGHLQRGVHGIVAAVVEEVPDVMRAEHFDQAFVFGAVLVQALQLEARGAEGARRRVAQAANGGLALLAAVDEVFRERADDPVSPRVHLADVLRVTRRRFDDAAGRGIDHGRDTARLRVKRVPGCGPSGPGRRFFGLFLLARRLFHRVYRGGGGRWRGRITQRR
jgi:hypothetical protein